MLKRHGFTLIELLVVITIIVVLVALLAPAMDQAIYQAELAQCAANQHGVGAVMSLYALDFKRAYPAPQLPAVGPFFFASQPADDRRPMLRNYCAINALFNCPLNADTDFASADAASWLLADHSMFWGFTYTASAGGGKGMTRLGDRWDFTAEGTTYRFQILQGDICRTSTPDSTQQVADSAHPDYDDAVLSLLTVHGTGIGAVGIGPLGFSGVIPITMSWWEIQNTNVRGLVDLNYLFADGSVARTTRIRWDDDRMLQVPQRYDDGNHGLNVMVPKSGQ